MCPCSNEGPTSQIKMVGTLTCVPVLNDVLHIAGPLLSSFNISDNNLTAGCAYYARNEWQIAVPWTRPKMSQLSWKHNMCTYVLCMYVCMCLLLIGVQAWKTIVRISIYWKKLQRKINGPTQLPRDQTNHTHPQSVVSYTTTESLLTVWLRLCPSSSFQPTATTWPDRLGYPDTTATDDKQRRTWTAHTNVSGASHQANRRPQISQTRGTTRWLPETLLPSSPITHKAGSKRCGVNKKCPYAAFLCLVPVITFPRSRWRLRSF